MFNINKTKIYLGGFLGILFGLLGVGCVNAETFLERLYEVGLDVASFSGKNSISRYEVARLLNAANCEDCIQSPDWMRNTYTQDFWNNFRAIDGKDFDDVNFEAGVWNKKSYYYCVAYVGDNGYMAGYPSTSTKCQGKFCGQESITMAEFYQTVLNIIQDQIRQKYQINWSKVKSWMKGLGKNSIQMKVLNQTDIQAINDADVKSKYAQNNDEFQAWLKYCMYNLSECNFQPFGVIGAGYWPVSELNVLYKEGLITSQDAEDTVKSLNIGGEDALRIFGKLFDSYANCSFNIDYDCDGIPNGQDNCPYSYNQNQYDLDGDGIGNVCDEDADGDGKKNPRGIVDDTNKIIISLWDDSLDQTPLGDNGLGFSLFVNVDNISKGLPATVKFSLLSNADIEQVKWDFGDGSEYVIGNEIKAIHKYEKSGLFTVKVVAKSKDGGTVVAVTKFFIAASQAEDYMLNIYPKFVFKDGGVEYTFSPIYSGDMDKIVRDVNNSNEKSLKVSENYKIKFKDDGTYVVSAKGYKNGELKAVSLLTISKKGSPSFVIMDITSRPLWEKTSLSTKLVGIIKSDIDYLVLDWGGEVDNLLKLDYDHVYNNPGTKVVQQNITLKDGTTLYNLATISVKNPLLTQSYAVNVSGKRLVYNQNDNLSLGLSVYPYTKVSSLFSDFQASKKQYFPSPNLSNHDINFLCDTAGNKALTNSVEINRCITLLNQGNVYVKGVDICESALKDGTLFKKYKCDMDKDGIPDICDDDIDGDGVKNLVGIIKFENKDCSVNSGNINSELLRKHVGVCSLDNCPFQSNEKQSDRNNNGIGDVCESIIPGLLSSYYSLDEGDDTISFDGDVDKDGIPDSVDQCPTLPGNSVDGCPELHSQSCWIYSDCGNGKIDEGETCANCPQDVGACCGNGKLEAWETCETCPKDAGICEFCGNGRIDEGETCMTCPRDVGKCTAFCGNGEIEPGEDCKNCPEDVKNCVAVCGNGEVEIPEDCKNCPEDVKMCRSITCGNGKVDTGSKEECDNGSDNGKDGKCTKMCTIYNPEQPKCGNGEIDNDEDEDCNTCSVDLGEKCIAEGEETEEMCGNDRIDEGETCVTCPEDVGECTAFCGNGKIEDAEDCRNCSQDVGECTAFCENGEVEDAEDCKNCPEDVKMCRNITCGNGKVDTGSKEECDNGSDNGKDGKCTKMCTLYNPEQPKCGNGEIDNDEDEDCDKCSVDLGEKCVKDGVKEKKFKCGNGKLDKGEECDPKDVMKKNWGNGECSSKCKIISGDVMCNPRFNGKLLDSVQNFSGLCLKGTLRGFRYYTGELRWGWLCVGANNNRVDNCYAEKSVCGDGYVGDIESEQCGNCPEDLKDICVTTGTSSDDVKCPNGKVDEGEDCNTCPEDVKDPCVAPNVPTDPDTPYNPVVPDNPEESEGWQIENDTCNICPCEYSDFQNSFTKGDTIRAKLWDSFRKAFYNYSNMVAIENFLDIK